MLPRVFIWYFINGLSIFSKPGGYISERCRWFLLFGLKWVHCYGVLEDPFLVEEKAYIDLHA